MRWIVGPVILVILDGWGISENREGNAILNARTPNYNFLLDNFLSSRLLASGEAVGLPRGLMGNSEVGHLTIGAGRVITQKLTLISNTIADGTFFENPALKGAVQYAQKHDGALHLIGLVSDGCVHSSPDHLDGLIELARRHKVEKLVIHPILDGRDTPPRSARGFMKELEGKLPDGYEIGVVCGRYWAMDRDSRWERTQRYYDAITLGRGIPASSAVAAVEQSYENDVSDEFVEPYIVGSRLIRDGDAVICFNFRPDRVRQISRALTQTSFDGFKRETRPDIFYACLTEYDSSLDLPVAFDPDSLPNQDIIMTLPELLSCKHVGQLHAAETEKYAHVTYFLNGGRETEVDGEKRVLVPSLKVATYDQAPSMQTPEVCRIACQAIRDREYPFIVLNFANPDMVGHTGFMDAAVEAVESVDDAFGQLLATTRECEGTLIITADHGNVEKMIELTTGEPHTAHTTSPVPFIVASFDAEAGSRLRNGVHLEDGSLADVAPTILDIMGLETPAQMSGKSLIKS